MRINITSNDIFSDKGEVILPKDIMEYLYIFAPQAFRGIQRVANNKSLWDNNGCVDGSIMLIIPNNDYSTYEDFKEHVKTMPAPVAVNVSLETFPSRKKVEPVCENKEECKCEEKKECKRPETNWSRRRYRLPFRPRRSYTSGIWDRLKDQYLKQTGSELKITDKVRKTVNDVLDELYKKHKECPHVEKVKDVIKEVADIDDNDVDIDIIPLKDKHYNYKYNEDELVYRLLSGLSKQLVHLSAQGIELPPTETFTEAFSRMVKYSQSWKANCKWIAKAVFKVVKVDFANIVDKEILVEHFTEQLIKKYCNVAVKLGKSHRPIVNNNQVWQKIARIFISIACTESLLEWKGLVMTRTGFNRIARVMIDVEAMKKADIYGVKNTIGITFPRRWDF